VHILIERYIMEITLRRGLENVNEAED